jgi:glutamate synthase (NADPH/NADH) small chain
VLQQDLEILEHVPMKFRFNSRLGSDVTLADLEEEFDAVFLAIGAGITLLEDFETNGEGLPTVDSVTFQTSRPAVFARGATLSVPEEWSPIRSISEGRRAAISIDRYLQKVSLTASRDNEGPYETRLFTNVEGVERSSRVPLTDPATGYSSDDAVKEADRCLLCECMECVKVCEYLAAFKGYPKKYVRLVYNNLSIVAGQRHGNLLINSCSLCGLCKEVCPEELHMGEVCKAARESMVEQNRMPPSAHEFALRDMEFCTSDLFALTRHEPGHATSTYLFFPGCQLSGSSPDNVIGSYTYLRERLEGGVGIMLRCCGAPADWSGRKNLFDRTFSEFETQWRELGGPTLIVACPSCRAMLSPRLPAEKITSLWEIIDRLGLPDPPGAARTTVVSLHDPCTARDDTAVQESVRNLVKKLGVEIHEPYLSRDKTECCSFGGLMYFANRDLAAKVMTRRIAAIPNTLLTYCAMCRDQYASHGKPARHLLDLIFGRAATEPPAAKSPDYSQRRENRARLKSSLLRDLWREDSVKHEAYQDIELHIAEDVRDLLEKRMILLEDIRQVIQWVAKTGIRLIHRRTGHFLAHHRPGTVTYWVEYSESGKAYTIHNAYSHRMKIVEDIKQ